MEDSSITELFFCRSENAIKETDRKYGRYCRTIANNILENNEETEECINDSYLDIWNAIPPERPLSFKAFIGRITRNNALNRLKLNSRKKRGGDITETILSELSECTDIHSDVEKISDSRFLAEEIEKYLRQCTPQKRKVFVQRYWYLMSIKDIADKNSIKENQIKSILFRMRSDLKKHLKNKELL